MQNTDAPNLLLPPNPYQEVFDTIESFTARNPNETEALRRVAPLWVRSLPADHPDYHDPDLMQLDFKMLGLIDDEGRIQKQAFNTAEIQIQSHFKEAVSYPKLWRFCASMKGEVSPAPIGDHFETYRDRIAAALERKAPQSEIVDLVLELEAQDYRIPSAFLCQAFRIKLLEQMGRFKGVSDIWGEIEELAHERALLWMPAAAPQDTLRQFFHNPNHAWGAKILKDWNDACKEAHCPSGFTPDLLSEIKQYSLREFGLLTKDHRPSELGLDRLYRLINRHQYKNRYSSNRSYVTARHSREQIRLELRCLYHRDQPLPFLWVLTDDEQPRYQLEAAMALANLALYGGFANCDAPVIKDSLSIAQYEQLLRIGAWLGGDTPNTSGLIWLRKAAEQKEINWQRWAKIFDYIRPKLNQLAKPAALSKYLRKWEARRVKAQKLQSLVQKLEGKGKGGKETDNPNPNKPVDDTGPHPHSP